MRNTLYTAYRKNKLYASGGGMSEYDTDPNAGMPKVPMATISGINLRPTDMNNTGWSGDIKKDLSVSPGLAAAARDNGPGVATPKKEASTGAGWQMASSIAGLASGALDNAGAWSKNITTGRAKTGVTTASSALKGAAFGTSILPGWGTVVGGVVGGAYGLIAGGAQKRRAIGKLMEENRLNNTMSQNLTQARIGADPNLVTGYKNSTMYRNGGRMYDRGGYIEPLTEAPNQVRTPYDDALINKGRYRPRMLYNPESVSNFPDLNTPIANNYIYNGAIDQNIRPVRNLTVGKALQTNVDYMKNNMPDSNIYRLENSHFSTTPTRPVKPNDNLAVVKYGGRIGKRLKRPPNMPLATEMPGAGLANGGSMAGANIAPAMAQFGVKNPQAETNSAPLARMFMQGGKAKSLSSNNAEMIGPSHADGGIAIPGMQADVEGGETTMDNYVFSKNLGFAALHKPIAVAKGRIERKPPTGERIAAIKRLAIREKELASQQDFIKQKLKLA